MAADSMAMLRLRLQSFGKPALVTATLIAAICCALVLLETWRVEKARRVQVEEARVATSNLAKSVAEMTTASLVQADLVLLGMVERLENEGLQPQQVDRVHRYLSNRKHTLPQLQRLGVINQSGRWIASDLETPDPSALQFDPAFFLYHSTHDERSPHFGPPTQMASSKEWVVTVSRRFNDAAGQFAGVAVASIALDYFNAYFAQYDIGPQGTIVLVHSNGTVLTRRPFKKEIINANIADGPLFKEHIAYDDHDVFWTTSRFDGLERLLAFQKAEQFPLYAVVTFAKADVLAQWVDDSLVQGVAVLLFLTMIAVVGVWLVRQTIRRHQDQLALTASRSALLEANRRLEDLVREDALTLIANRREFDRVLSDALARVARAGGSFAMLMIDIDHFKRFNDTYGHVEGDACLRAVADLIRTTVSRPTDLVARYGGEEFAVLLWDTDVHGAKQVAERLLRVMDRAALPHRSCANGIVTISIGIAATSGESAIPCPRAMTEAADRALYHAKRAGRNTARVAGEDEEGMGRPVPMDRVPVPEGVLSTA